jgi:hypothetical protein
MNDFHTITLQQSTNNIDGRIMTIKKGSCRDDPDMVPWPVGFDDRIHVSSFLNLDIWQNLYDGTTGGSTPSRGKQKQKSGSTLTVS